MKAEKEKIGIFQRFIKVVTHNWGLKLLSLILAIIVYHSLKPESGRNHQNYNDPRPLFKY